MSNFSDENLVFIVSQPRSGSTLLQSILNNHPQISTLPEPWLLLHLLAPLKKSQNEQNLTQEAVKNFITGLPLGEETYQNAAKTMALSLYSKALGNSETIFVDKTPRYYQILPEIRQTFPKSLIIILYRNPLAVLISMIRRKQASWAQLNFNKEDLLLAPFQLLAGESLGNIIRLRYEDLVNSPQMLTPIYETLNLNVQEDFENFLLPKQASKDSRMMGDQSIRQTNSVESDRASKWMDALKDPQMWRLAKDYLDYLGAEVFENLGYSFLEQEQMLMQYRPQKLFQLNTVSLEWVLNQQEIKQSWQFRRYRLLQRFF